jgi:hypothetical protein
MNWRFPITCLLTCAAIAAQHLVFYALCRRYHGGDVEDVITGDAEVVSHVPE